LHDGGLRAGWRLLIYAAFVAVLGFGGELVLRQFVRPSHGVFSPGYFFIQEAFSFIVIFAAAIIMARIERQSVGVYGLPIRGAFGKLFWQGWVIGLVEVSVLIGLIAAFGGYSFGDLAVHGRELLRWGLLWAVFFVFVGLFEEFLFRGYAQYTLRDGIGFWPAAVVLSCSFVAVVSFLPASP
jgi:membrane protease YdiL (CAAX protease family)